MRNSLDYASWKDHRGLAAAIRPICYRYFYGYRLMWRRLPTLDNSKNKKYRF